jgi:ketosteroid isomerase-like protein
MTKQVWAAAFIASLVAAGAAQSAPVKTNCSRGADARVIEVVEPGVVGQSCDVRYTRGGANVTVPYHADNSDSFCNQKATEIVKRLMLSGFACNTSAPALRAEAAPASTTSASDYVVEVQRPATAPQLASAADVAPPSAPAVEAPAETAMAVAEGEQSDALDAQMNEILSQPVLQAEPAPGAPKQLLAQQTETLPIRPQPSSVGRLVGATPETSRPAISVTQASVVVQEPEASEEAATPLPAPVKTTPTPAKAESQPAVAGLRSPADVVRATLMAQAAAWNEGDIDGFMNGYWKSDELKFVSGGNITKGWDATLKRYRERYAGGSGLGQLGFEKLEVKLMTDDVAVVTGRFNLLNNGVNSSGLFSLVMRRDNGAWRIVHDHTSADPKPPQ